MPLFEPSQSAILIANFRRTGRGRGNDCYRLLHEGRFWACDPVGLALSLPLGHTADESAEGKALLTKRSSTFRSFAGAVVSLDPVAVRIDDKGGIVTDAVYRPQAGCMVVLPAGAQRGRMNALTAVASGAAKQKCKPDFSSKNCSFSQDAMRQSSRAVLRQRSNGVGLVVWSCERSCLRG